METLFRNYGIVACTPSTFSNREMFEIDIYAGRNNESGVNISFKDDVFLVRTSRDDYESIDVNQNYKFMRNISTIMVSMKI